ncbi:hypothetical protein C8J36_11925 [Rhizobium sp. PP-F2F-G48]|nr:hypothetical protein C8J36_11925 [Rhizobium sp. PP-F2F-G48]
MGLKAPVRVIPRVLKNEHRYISAAARGALRADRAGCPVCETGSLRPTGDTEARCCDQCGTVVTLDDLAIFNGERLEDSATQRHDYFRRHARLLGQVAALSLVLAAGASLYAASAQMLVAALLLSVPILAGVFAMRYRAWQAATGRVYEAKAPFGDFMRDELRGLIGGRG